MNQSITRRMAVAWPAALLIALALHSSGRAEANNGLSAYATPVQKYALALEAQTQGDYPAMLTWLRAAAREGHAPAQRMLGIALLGGPALYGTGQPADLCEGRLWLLRAASQGGADDVAYALFGRPRDPLTAHCEAA
ncbi:sel1 repeat family protein [Achromobacter deleyi]|uniref:Sel1 repeat family protein n=1 Tax=Achromobacter deleyi TaxID=1353891 RepID=A0A7T4B812_9BURK|nr:sel1 repeat family protein [Achromobacter deleyi]QQB37456.1 sel1 repeat family protein [Achromobacter deleyi]